MPRCILGSGVDEDYSEVVGFSAVDAGAASDRESAESQT